MRFKKRYWHCSDYDIEIIDVCALSGDIICLLIMKIQASEINNQTQWFVLVYVQEFLLHFKYLFW